MFESLARSLVTGWLLALWIVGTATAAQERFVTDTSEATMVSARAQGEAARIERPPPIVIVGGDDRPPPGHLRVLRVAQVRVGPVIDGRVDDLAWRLAEASSGFWVIEQQRWPTEQTEVRALSDGRYLYLAFQAFDRVPQGIEALETRRGSGLGLDDQFVIELDPFYSHRNVSKFSFNAAGTQTEVIAAGRASNIAWSGDWHVATARTSHGWSAEVAIPFGILNYSPGDSVFGVNFRRYQHRTDEWSSWADRTLQNKPEEMGRLTGLILPEAPLQRAWTVMPYVLAGHNVPDRDGVIEERLATAGVDLRYEPTPKKTGVVSLNPDFTQIETQVTSIDFDYNEKFVPDARPFFQEGSGYYGQDSSYFYSLRIPDFDVGAKFFGRIDRSRLGLLATRAPEDRVDAVARYVYDFDATHSGTVTAVSTDRVDLENRLLAARFEGRRKTGLGYELDLAWTDTLNAGDNGSHERLAVGWDAGYWSLGLSTDHYNVDYYPANGLVDQDLIDTRGIETYMAYSRDLGAGLIRVIDGGLGWTGRDTDDGLNQTREWYVNGGLELEQRIAISVFHSDSEYRPVAGGPGLWSTTVNEDNYWNVNLDLNTRSSRLGLGTAYAWGDIGGGDYAYSSAYLWAKPSPSTSVNVTGERLESFGTFDQTIVSASWDVTHHSGLSVRFIVADEDEYKRVAYRFQGRGGFDIFVVYDDEPNTPAESSVKLAYSFR